MVRFIDKRNNQIKIAFSIRPDGDKYFVRFSPNGKEYSYLKTNITPLYDNNNSVDNTKIPFTVYKFGKYCHRCGQKIDVLTYIIYDDNTNDDVTFPWDKERLLKTQDFFAHMVDESIEYYGLRVLGDFEEYDKIMVSHFPNNIAFSYSKTTDSTYAMNLCPNCLANQGRNYIYRYVNQAIEQSNPIDIYMK